MGIFNTETTPQKTTHQLVKEVRVVMSKEIGVTLTTDQAIERLCNIFLTETTK
jgi:hypothetical protein